MKPSAATKRLLARLGLNARSLPTLLPADGIEAMLAFYAEERVDGCSLDDDGDMLLYQWGTNDWGEGEAFEFNITRQFMDARDVIRQLSLTFTFEPGKQTRACGEGNKWCESPDDVEKFRRFILTSKAYKLAKSLAPNDVTLELTRP
jgi:hypothetical protein